MTKTTINIIIANLKKARLVTKATPWLVEGIGDKAYDVRYVGITPPPDWADILPAGNNLLIKFVKDTVSTKMEFYLANKPPFLKITQVFLSESDTWEKLFGAFKQRLRRDKDACIHHTDNVGNWYAKIRTQLK